MTRKILTGRYARVDGRVESDDDAKAIFRMLQGMLLLAGSGEGPEFFFDPSDSSYWQFTEFADDYVQLMRVTREYIEQNWPNVKCDERLSVDWPSRD